jgi:hypothetical protein
MSDRQPVPCPSDDRPPSVSPTVRRWRLWIDRGGGFDVWQGERLTLGGAGGSPLADFAIRCAWPSRVATLDRSAIGDRLTPAERWQLTPAHVAPPYGALQGPSHSASAQERPLTDRPLLADQLLRLQPEGSIGQPGSNPVIHYRRPSPLSRSAVLSVLPPYRTVSPVDALIWLEQTVLIGPESFNHAQTPGLSPQQWVLFRRHDEWWIRGESVEPQPLPEGRMWQVADWSLTIQPE